MAWQINLAGFGTVDIPCRWRAVYEDLSEYDSETCAIADLPQDGLQGFVIVDFPYPTTLEVDVDGNPSLEGIKFRNFPVTGRETYGLLPDGAVRGVYFGVDLKSFYPDARVFDSRVIPTRQYHKVEKLLGVWETKDPFPGWEKDVVGLKVWTSDSVFDTKGIPEKDWGAWWSSLPDDVQACTAYENYLAPEGHQSVQFIGGDPLTYFAETPDGPVVWNTANDAAHVLSHHPNAIIKSKKNITNRRRLAIIEEQTAIGLF